MSRYMADEKESTFFLDVLKIALGVFIGCLLAAFAFSKYIDWEMNRAVWQFDKTMSRETQRMKSDAEQYLKSSERAMQRRSAAEQIEADRIALQAKQAQIARNQEAERDVRRQEAWESYYQPSAACKADSSTMDCANAFMAAKKRFLERFRD